MKDALNDEIALLMDKARKKLEAARRILADGLYEDAVSRAYYAMFHASRAMLVPRNMKAKTHPGVAAVIRLGLPDPNLARKFGHAALMCKIGNRAALFEPSKDDAEAVVSDAAELVTEAEELLARLRVS